MRKVVFLVAVLAEAVGAVIWWRRNRRAGSAFVNRVVNPWLVRRGLVGVSRGELALIEHAGRKSGTVRQTPIHPMPIEGGYRIIAPVGELSEWVRNVQAAGRCRLILADRTVELDEPVLETPNDVPGLARPLKALFGWLGFRYLRLHTFGESPMQELVSEESAAQPAALTTA